MNIIICDDEQYYLESIKQILEKICYENTINMDIHCCRYPAQCEAYFKQYGADLVIADMYLENALGIDLVKRLRKLQKKHFSLLFISAKNSYAAETYELEADGYLLKPLNQELFQKAVISLLKPYQLSA